MGSPRRMPTRRAIFEHWREWTYERFDGITNVGMCFACGIESRVTLERAHIVARCNGGPDTVENLHLLCGVCHKVSEFIEGDHYWEWLTEWTTFDRGFVAMALDGFPLWSRYMSHMRWPQDLPEDSRAFKMPDWIERPSPLEVVND